MDGAHMSDVIPLEVDGLTKVYAKLTILDGLSFRVSPGEAVALVGPNGTGKSTCIGCVVGGVVPDGGQVKIGGEALARHPIEARRQLRYLAQEVDAPMGLTGREVIEFHADVFGDRTQVEASVRMADLGPSIEHLVTTYSVGMRKRLMFSSLMAGRGRLYVLDEPFAGIDGEGRTRMVAWLKKRLADGAGMLLAAHDSDVPELDAIEARRLPLTRRASQDEAPA